MPSVYLSAVSQATGAVAPALAVLDPTSGVTVTVTGAVSASAGYSLEAIAVGSERSAGTRRKKQVQGKVSDLDR
jgi:hypothetical protein